MSALLAYRTLLRIVGPAYILVAFLGRVPLAMSQMGTLILVSSVTGSYGLGGAAAGVLAVANAIGAPFAGGLADRIGQRPVVLVQSLLGALGLGAIVVVTHEGVSAVVLLSVAAVAGVAIPQIGPLARVRWAPITAGREDSSQLVNTAFSYEGAADEASFVLGPALLGVLAVALSPGGALWIAAGVLAVCGTAFAVHPTAALTVPDASIPRDRGRLFTLAFGTLIAAQVCVGMIFGATQTGSAVLATEQGQPGIAGLMHATLGVGSVVAGLAVAALPESITYPKRSVVSAAGLLVLSVPLVLIGSISGAVIVIFFLGFAVAPYMISNFAYAGLLVPSGRVGAAMTMLAGATGIGYATGSSIAGRLADHGGFTPAFAVTIASGGLAFAVAWVLHASARRP